MSPSAFKSSVSITHISTAAALIDIDGVTLLTDPFFSPAGTKWDFNGITLENTETPALGLENLPHIDGVLLSHEDHADNLDELGRQLLDGRRVFTTVDGARKLAPRPDVRGMKPWESVSTMLGGKKFNITATPCEHVPGGECNGFILTTEDFGTHSDGRPNAIFFTGDTVYLDEFEKIPDKFHVVVAIVNLGRVLIPGPSGQLQATMDGAQGVQLLRTLRADYLVPMHYESWKHFTQHGDELAKIFDQEGVSDKVRWLSPGNAVKIL